jgi:carbamate kinase
LQAGQVVIAAGGGGIPVIEENGELNGVGAVIDKDFASCLLAKELDADLLIILTAVEKVAIRFNTPQQEWLSNLTVSRANELIGEGHFAPGSMLPKVQAAVDFASSKPGRQALITLLQKAKDGIEGKTGTMILSD